MSSAKIPPHRGRLRRLAVYVDEPAPGAYHWVMIENEDDASTWVDLEYSGELFAVWIDAWDAGCVAMHRLVFDEVRGPRSPVEDEDADPVG